MYETRHQFPNEFFVAHDKPCISLYQPTHRHYPENKQDTIVFKNLLKKVEESLAHTYAKRTISAIMEPLYEIEQDKALWNNTMDGLAVFADANKCIVYSLHRPVNELAIVADSFHIKPLIKEYQFLKEYQLLCLSRDDFALYQGNQYSLAQIEIDPGVPRTLKEVFSKQATIPYLTHGSHGGANQPALYHGHGDTSEEIKKDTEKYYRYVDRYIMDHYTKQSRMPLILVGLPENQSEFRRISHNPGLMEEGINRAHDSLKMEDLKNELEILTGDDFENAKKLIESYKSAEARSLGFSELRQVAEAACNGRIETLILQEDMVIPGKINPDTGALKLGDIQAPDHDDVLDDMAEMVLKMKGGVVVLSKEHMPVDTGVAAILRY